MINKFLSSPKAYFRPEPAPVNLVLPPLQLDLDSSSRGPVVHSEEVVQMFRAMDGTSNICRLGLLPDDFKRFADALNRFYLTIPTFSCDASDDMRAPLARALSVLARTLESLRARFSVAKCEARISRRSNWENFSYSVSRAYALAVQLREFAVCVKDSLPPGTLDRGLRLLGREIANGANEGCFYRCKRT